MQVVRLRHVKRYRAGGRVYWYHRITKERLPDDEAERAARVLHINANLDGWRDDTIPGSIGDVICRYKANPGVQTAGRGNAPGLPVPPSHCWSAASPTTPSPIST